MNYIYIRLLDDVLPADRCVWSIPKRGAVEVRVVGDLRRDEHGQEAPLIYVMPEGSDPALAVTAWLNGDLKVTPNENGVVDLPAAWRAQQRARAFEHREISTEVVHSNTGGAYVGHLGAAVPPFNVEQEGGPRLLDTASLIRKITEKHERGE